MTCMRMTAVFLFTAVILLSSSIQLCSSFLLPCTRSLRTTTVRTSSPTLKFDRKAISSHHRLTTTLSSAITPESESNLIQSQTTTTKTPNTFYKRKEWTQEQYLKFHQTVGKRKTIRRLLEILSVLSGKIMRPLVCSLVKNPPPIPNLIEQQTTQSSPSSKIKEKKKKKQSNNNSWDEFWLRQSRSITNAERVAKGLPPLGPTFVKIGQALATRPDIIHVPLAESLANLQDRVAPFDDFIAKRIIRRELKLLLKNKEQGYINSEEELNAFLNSISAEPIAAASVAQIYKARLPNYGDVAIKVQRPGIRKTAEKDATLLHTLATFVERTIFTKFPRWIPIKSLRDEFIGSIATTTSSSRSQKKKQPPQIVKTVDEFTARILEDMDFEREATNMQLFADMYCHKRGSSQDVKVIVPELIPPLSSRHMIIMEWIDGTKLTDICTSCDYDESISEVQENLDLVKKAIEVTLSQLLTTGLVHSDPHTGNLLKVRTTRSTMNGKTTKRRKPELGYLDFGLVNTVPQRFQDGIVCATVQLVFARNIEAVADLCVDLGLLPEEKLKDAKERERFVDELEKAINEVLIWPKDEKGLSTAVPKIRFENALPALSSLITNFEFTVPPYFLNNARAIATLEGIALKLDPNFNILRVIYPYSINHLMKNPSISSKSEETFLNICQNPKTKLFDHHKFMMLLNDWSLLTGYRKRKIYWDLVTSVGTRRVMGRIFKENVRKHVRFWKEVYYRYIWVHWERGWLMSQNAY